MDVESRSGLVRAIIDDLEDKIDSLGIEETVFMLWSVSKFDRKGKMSVVIALFKRVTELLGSE